jgi:polysaccharide export outer membrane protein/exopolysaccharide production protein ExoF
MCRLFVATASLIILLAGSATAQPGSHDTSYRLGVGDQVRLKVFEWRSTVGEVHEWSALNSDFRVGPDGSLSLPLLGAVAATGHTVDELADAIAKSLQSVVGLALKPQASVEVVQFRPFYILGSVNHPGEYTYRPGMTLLQAVSIAGGLHRVDDPSLLMFQRNSLTTAGDLRVSQLDYNGFLARRARLQAELDGSDKITFPPDLLRQQNDAVVAQLIQREQVMFGARRNALRSQLDAFKSLKDLLSGEVASLQAKIKNVDEELAMLKAERTNTTNLVRQGLAVAPREFSMRQAEVQTQGRRLDLDTAVLRAREDIGKADQNVLELQNKFRNDVLSELAEVERKLSEVAARIKTNQMIAEREITEPELASILSQAHGELVYSIIRGTGGEAREMPANETSIVEPGDTVRVKRNTETSAQYGSAAGNSVDLPAETPAKAAAPAKRPRER